MINHPLQQYIHSPMKQPIMPMAPQNPIQRFQLFARAMQNPVSFIRQNLPGIPEQAFNDPTGNGVLQYMMQNLGVTQQDIQNAVNQIPRF